MHDSNHKPGGWLFDELSIHIVKNKKDVTSNPLSMFFIKLLICPCVLLGRFRNKRLLFLKQRKKMFDYHYWKGKTSFYVSCCTLCDYSCQSKTEISIRCFTIASVSLNVCGFGVFLMQKLFGENNKWCVFSQFQVLFDLWILKTNQNTYHNLQSYRKPLIS